MPYSAAVAAVSRRAPRTVKLAPSGFADTWDGKPEAPVEMGLRLIPEGELATARSVAVKSAMQLHPELDERSDIWLEAYNQALMHWAIAHALCRPDDVTQPFWEMAEDLVPIALNSAGTLRLYEELELLTVLESPLSPEIDDVGIETLSAVMSDPDRRRLLPVSTLRRLRRLLGHALEELAAAGVTTDT